MYYVLSNVAFISMYYVYFTAFVASFFAAVSLVADAMQSR
jgi:hypothetical protein